MGMTPLVEVHDLEELGRALDVGARVIGAAEQGHSIQGLDQPVFDAKPTFTDAEWTRLTEGLDKLGKLAQDALLARNLAAVLVAAHGRDGALRVLEGTRLDAAVADDDAPENRLDQ